MPTKRAFSSFLIFWLQKLQLLEKALCAFAPLLAPPEGLCAPGLPGVNPGGGPQESGSDSKAI